MSDEEHRGTGSLIPLVRGEIVSRSTSLVRRGLNLLEPQKPTEDETLTRLRERVNAGDADAQNQLGAVYEHGFLGVRQDSVEAVQWFRKAAEQGDSDAVVNMGWAYAFGRGVPQDDDEAAKWCRKAAEQGNDWAWHLGWAYAHGEGDMPQDDAKAAQWYRLAAEHGDSNGQYNLGVMFARGRGVPQDYGQAVEWFRKAAEQGIVNAQFELGWAYATSRGVLGDDAQAVEWFRKAAEQGSVNAQFELGLAYSNAEYEGTSQDCVEAYKWMSIAVSRMSNGDHPRAAAWRDANAKKMTPTQIADATERARRWVEAFENRNK